SGGEGARHDERGRKDRARGKEMDLAEPDAVEPPRLRGIHGLQQLLKELAVRGAVAQLFEEEADVPHHIARKPPSTTSSVPVMYDASSEARNSTACATSSTRPSRFIGTNRSDFSRHAGSAESFEVFIGGMMPGCTELTRMPCCAN